MSSLSRFTYEKETGNIFRSSGADGRHKTGIVSSKNNKGYIEFKCNGVRIRAHTFAFDFLGIEIPDGCEVDHINGVRHDNRFENLRIVSHRDNCQNLPLHREGKLIGACKKGNSFTSSIMVNNKKIHLGSFPTEHQASEQYKKASDHIQGIQFSNEIENILNKPKRVVAGYTRDKKSNKFMVKFRRKYIGNYNTESEAKEAYLSAKNSFEEQ